jgi:hypothetical protein
VDEMKRTRLDDRTADRILSGAVTSDDAPPGYAGVAGLLHSAADQPAAGGLTREAATVASMRAAILGHPVPLTASRRRNVLKKVITAKAAAAAVVVVLGATGAAAATGALPDSAQSTAKSVLSALSINVPGPNSHAGTNVSTNDSTTSTTSTTSTSTTVASNNVTTTTVKGPNANADFGLCTAAEAHQDNGAQPHSTVFPKPDSATCTSVIAAHNAAKGSSDTSNTADSTSTTSTTVSGHAHGSSTSDGTESDGADSTGATQSGTHHS